MQRLDNEFVIRAIEVLQDLQSTSELRYWGWSTMLVEISER